MIPLVRTLMDLNNYSFVLAKLLVGGHTLIMLACKGTYLVRKSEQNVKIRQKRVNVIKVWPLHCKCLQTNDRQTNV